MLYIYIYIYIYIIYIYIYIIYIYDLMELKLLAKWDQMEVGHCS